MKRTIAAFMVFAVAPILYMSVFSLGSFQDYNPVVILGTMLIVLPYLEHKKRNLGIVVPLFQLLIVLTSIFATQDFSLMLNLAAGYLLIYPLFSMWLLATETRVGSMISIYVSSYLASLFTYSSTLSGKVDSVGLVGNLAVPVIKFFQQSGATAAGQPYPPFSFSSDIWISALSAIGTIGFIAYVLRFSADPMLRERENYFFDIFSRGLLFILPITAIAVIGYVILGDFLVVLFGVASLGMAIFLKRTIKNSNASVT